MFTPNIEQLLTQSKPVPTAKEVIQSVADGAAVARTDKPDPRPAVWSPTAAIAGMTTVPPKQIESKEI
jgi:hypothetical protein